MAPRANWKGFLRLSLVTCPVALYPATSESEKISFNQLNRKTGHRIKYAKVDADTGEEVANEDIVKGYALDKDTFVEVTKEELEDLALESTRTIEIDEMEQRRAGANEVLRDPVRAVGRRAFAGGRTWPQHQARATCLEVDARDDLQLASAASSRRWKLTGRLPCESIASWKRPSENFAPSLRFSSSRSRNRSTRPSRYDSW